MDDEADLDWCCGEEEEGREEESKKRRVLRAKVWQIVELWKTMKSDPELGRVRL
jgi:hypothetical protein